MCGLNISFWYYSGSSSRANVLENGGSHGAPGTSTSHLDDTLQPTGQPQLDTTHPDVLAGEPRTRDKGTQVSKEMPT